MKRLIVFVILFLNFAFYGCRGRNSIDGQTVSENHTTTELPEAPNPIEFSEITAEKTDTAIAKKEAKLVFIDKRIVQVVYDVRTGSIFRKSIRIKNEGNIELVILNYKLSCRCTSVELPDVLKPGEDGEIIIEIDTTDKLGKSTTTVLFETNTTQKDYVIRIDMNIIP